MVSARNNIVKDLQYIYEKPQGSLGEFVGLHKWSIDFTVSFFSYLENHFIINGKNDGYDWLIGRFINQTHYILYYQTIDDFKWVNVNHKEDYLYAKELSKTFNGILLNE